MKDFGAVIGKIGDLFKAGGDGGAFYQCMLRLLDLKTERYFENQSQCSSYFVNVLDSLVVFAKCVRNVSHVIQCLHLLSKSVSKCRLQLFLSKNYAETFFPFILKALDSAKNADDFCEVCEEVFFLVSTLVPIQGTPQKYVENYTVLCHMVAINFLKHLTTTFSKDNLQDGSERTKDLFVSSAFVSRMNVGPVLRDLFQLLKQSKDKEVS